MSETSTRPTEEFSFDTARDYWKFAPSSKGKVNTVDLCARDEEEFLRTWTDSYQRRLDHYWEDQHYVHHFSKIFAGKRILSFGSGLGFNEVYFMRAGAHVTCADIVESNLAVIARVCKAEGLDNAAFMFMTNSAEQDFGGPYDHIYVRGSLMHMPSELQAKVLANFKKALAPGGLIILNVYTWKFVEDTVGLDDPVLFARASDPSVGENHCPWADWYDDEKLLNLAGGAMYVPYRQYWNQGWYVWYALARKEGDEVPPTQPFVDLGSLAAAEARPVWTCALEDMTASEASFGVVSPDGLEVETTENQFYYAASTAEIKRDELEMLPDRLQLEVDLQAGGISVSILDLVADKMAATLAIAWPGRHHHHLSLRHVELPERFKIVISNNCTKGPAVSKFVLHSLSLDRQISD